MEKARLSGRQLARSVVLKVQTRFRIWPKRFCLVTGAPRSGTSAMCRWLGTHRDIGSFYESRILIALHGFLRDVSRFYYLDKHREELTLQARELALQHYGHQGVLVGKKVLLDKEPLEPMAFPDGEFEAFLRSVRRLFPHASFLFMLRDPVETVWSMRQRKWGFTIIGQEPRTYSIEEHTHNWCQSVDLMLRYLGDTKSYICPFGRLIREPVEESRRIFEFLGLRPGTTFEARPTKTPGFTQEERDLIMEIAAPQLEALAAHCLLQTSPNRELAASASARLSHRPH